MTTLWVVIILLSVLVVLDSLAVIALMRQVGVLHLRLDTRPLPAAPAVPEPPVQRGPHIGAPLSLDLGSVLGGGDRPDRVVIAFVAPNCGTCTGLLPVFGSVAANLPANERLVLASHFDEDRVRAYLAEHGVSALPLITSPDILLSNHVPGTPFIIVADSGGLALAAGAVHNLAQVEFLLGEARRVRASAGPTASQPDGGDRALALVVNQ